MAIMQSFYDYKKFAILYVDDEEKSLKLFNLAFKDQFRVLTASNAREGFQLLEAHKDEIGVLITDQRMPGETGVQLLERARELRPRIIRVLATAYTDFDAAIQAVNAGAIYKYISKPWDGPALEVALKRALEFFLVQRERDQLLREKMTVIHKMMITDRVLSLGILAAGLGHYVRNSLIAVRTFLDMAPARLKEEKIDFDEIRNPRFWNDFYQHAQTQIRRITDMLHDLGAVSEPPPFQFEDQVQLHAVLVDALRQLEPQLKEKQITVDNQVPETLPILRVNRRKFVRLFDLLLKDEAVSLPPGSRITLKATAVPSTDHTGSEVLFLLEDNGPGLPQEDLRSVFDPFFLRADQPQEFGINLMACYFIVYHHGGRIEVRNQEGQGVTFLITLPTDPETPGVISNEQEFLAKVLQNDALWEKLLSSP